MAWVTPKGETINTGSKNKGPGTQGPEDPKS